MHVLLVTAESINLRALFRMELGVVPPHFLVSTPESSPSLTGFLIIFVSAALRLHFPSFIVVDESTQGAATCQKDKIVDLETGGLNSPNFDGRSVYDFNQECSWIIR